MLLVLGGIATRVARQPERSAAELMDAVMWNREPIGGPFTLIDTTASPHRRGLPRQADAGLFRLQLCPDICPTDLQAIGLAMDRLGPAGEAVQPIFITVDPEQDTPQLLADMSDVSSAPDRLKR